MRLQIRELAKLLNAQLVLGDPKREVFRAACDSRKVRPGDLFFALKGEHTDGHQFVLSGLREGAAAAVVSNLDWMNQLRGLEAGVLRVSEPLKSLKALAKTLRSSFKGPVVGITGSNGKTTTKQMVKKILEHLGPGLATRGNYNSQIGVPLVLSELEPIHAWMALEMGASEPGNIAALAELGRPTVGILTSIGPAHLATFGSMERLVETKWELMESLPSDGAAILPWGETRLEPHIRKYKKRIVYFGTDASCPVRASTIETGESLRFRLHAASASRTVVLPIAGRMNVRNALAATAAGWVLGIPLEKIAASLETFEPPEMRMETKVHSSGAVLINDAYNANPASMIESVRSMAETYPSRKKIVVMGSMLELGPESERWHFHVGTELAKFNLDHVFLVGSETKPVLEGAVGAGRPKDQVTWMEDASGLSEILRRRLAPESVVLFKASRGLQLETVVHAL